jgi:hypothetical protein
MKAAPAGCHEKNQLLNADQDTVSAHSVALAKADCKYGNAFPRGISGGVSRL